MRVIESMDDGTHVLILSRDEAIGLRMVLRDSDSEIMAGSALDELLTGLTHPREVGSLASMLGRGVLSEQLLTHKP